MRDGARRSDQHTIALETAPPDLPKSPGALFRQTWHDYQMIRATKYGALPLTVISLLAFAEGLDDRIFTLLAPEIRRDFNVSLTKLLLATQLLTVVGIAAVPLVGYLSDRLRRTRLLGISALIAGVFTLLSTLPGGLGAHLGLKAVAGTGRELGTVPTSSLLYDYYPIEARAKTVALRNVMSAVLGPAAAVLIGLMATAWGWRVAVRACTPAFMLIGLYAIWRLREPVRGYWERLGAGEDEATAELPQPPVKFGEALRTIMRIKTFRRLMFLTPLLAIAGTGFGTLYSFFLVQQFRLSPSARSLIGLPGSVLAVFALMFGGVLADRLIRKNPSRVLVIGAVLSMATALSQVVIVLFPSLVLVIGFGIVLGVVSQLLIPAQAVVGSLIIPPRLRGQGISVIVLFILPTIPFASLPGYVADHYGLRTGLLIYAPLMLIGSLLSISAARFMNVDHRAMLASANATNDYNRAKAEGRIKLLLLRDVDVAYDDVQVVFHVDLDVDEGETIALLGTNGAGKSTVLKAISGVQEADNGAIFFDGRDITHLPPHEVAKLGIVHMPGGKCVFPSLSVRQNLELALVEAPDPQAARERLEQVFSFFPVLRDRLGQPAGTLSGGEQQMVGLGQAFLWKPRLLMIDELSLGLSPAVVGQLLGIVREINREGATVVLVEQSVNVALTVTERAIFMEKGEVRFDGPTAELLARPDIMRAVYVKGSAGVSGASSRSERPARDPGRTLLDVREVAISFGGVRALDGASFTLSEGRSLGIIGPNGAGKSTLVDVISGYLPPDAGQVWFDQVDITGLTAEQRGQRGLVRRFQSAKLFAALSVQEAICLALDRQLEVRNIFLSALPLSAVRKGEARVRARAERIIEMFDLGDCRDRWVSELSTGLRRIVDLACVVAAEPRLLLLDEPSSGIAQAETEGLAAVLNRIRHDTGTSLVIIEHDMTLLRAVSDELLAMVQGQVVARGRADDVLEHPQVVAAYLGDDAAAIQRSGVLT